MPTYRSLYALFAEYNRAMFCLRPLALLAVVLFSISCTPSSSPSASASEEAAIRALDEQWSAIAAKNDLDGTVAYYADDAVLLPPNASIAAGQKSIRESWAGLLGPNTSVSWRATKAEVAKSGELGYLYGTYQLSMKDPKGGPAINDRGKLVEVWRKQADGKWKCIVDTYNSDIPLPAPAETKK